MDRSNFESRIAAEPYTVSWKADGTRYMLGIRNGNVYLADRDFRIYRAVLHFPDRKLLKAPAQTARATKSAIDPVPTVRHWKDRREGGQETGGMAREEGFGPSDRAVVATLFPCGARSTQRACALCCCRSRTPLWTANW